LVAGSDPVIGQIENLAALGGQRQLQRALTAASSLAICNSNPRAFDRLGSVVLALLRQQIRPTRRA
jgi:hypothetical protein